MMVGMCSCGGNGPDLGVPTLGGFLGGFLDTFLGGWLVANGVASVQVRRHRARQDVSSRRSRARATRGSWGEARR
jgi:hypothetical protein